MSRPIFVGNFEYDTRQSELERLFSKYGRVERVDMKSGTILFQILSLLILSVLYLVLLTPVMHLVLHFDFFFLICKCKILA